VSDATDTGAHRAAIDPATIASLEAERDASRDHRTRVNTLLSVASGIAITAAVVFGGAAMAVRDTALATAARVQAVEARTAAIESAKGARDVDDRASAAAIVRLQTTVDAMQHSLDARLGAIESRLSQDDRTPRR
jgi:hypothetical protein